MSRDLSLLHPKLRQIVPQIIQRCEMLGLPVLITDGFRSKAEQDNIYAQGRTKPGQIVTQVRWPNSAHNWGVAVDFCRNLKGHEYDDGDGFFRRVAQVAKGFGLEWGGDWHNFVDKPHLQLAEYMPGNSTAWLKKTYGSPEQFRASWETEEAKEDGDVRRFATVVDAPDYAKTTLYKLMNFGIILGDGNPNQNQRVIDVSEDMVRVLVWLDRAGIFDGRSAE